MKLNLTLAGGCVMVALAVSAAPGRAQQSDAATDPVLELVGRLDLEKYKATIKGLTEFGDRRQGTDRNRAAVDWIEVQLRSYGCQNVERITYEFNPAPPAGRGGGAGGRAGAPAAAGGRGGGRGSTQITGVVMGSG